LLFRPRYRTLTDLVRACQRLEPAAQTAFYDRYKRRLLGVCLRYARTDAEAEDIFQDAFIKVFARIGQLEKPEAADAWVKSVVIRTAINHYHRATKPAQHQTYYDEIADTRDSGDYDKLLAGLNTEALLAIINQLPDPQRLVLNLFLIDGYGHADIAELLNMPENTSKSHLLRGRVTLIQKLARLGIHRYETT
jgi:RNA polymerase sigma factor (sigma-70 family)